MDFFQPITRLVNSLTKLVGGGIGGLLMAVGTIVFFISVISFIAARAKGDGKGLEDAKNRLLLAAVGLFFMVAVWGIVRFLEVNILGNQVRCADVPQTIFRAGAQQQSSGCGSGGTYYGSSGSDDCSRASAGEYCVRGANTTGGSGGGVPSLSEPYGLTPVPNAPNSGTNCTDFRTCSDPGRLDN